MAQKNNYLFELGCEEIPARFVSKLSVEIKNGFETSFQNERIEFGVIHVYATYRRFVVIVYDIESRQKDLVEYVKGPPEKLVYDSEKKFTQASLGFAKKHNVEPSKCLLKEFNGKMHLSFCNQIKGDKINRVLSKIIPEIILAIPLPIAMKWHNYDQDFVRPIQWVVSVYNNEVVPFTIFGIKAGSTSYGHRFLSKGNHSLGKSFKVNQHDLILDQYKKMNVILDPAERMSIISNQMMSFSQEKIDSELLAEIIYLVEFPVVLKGSFSKKYLELPKIVLIECMKKHQRYFPYYENGKLRASFLVVADNVTNLNKLQIISGNQNVLTARLEDAMFFYNKDRLQELSFFSDKLKGVVFQKNGGSMFDKQTRILKILIFFKQTNLIEFDDLILKKLATLSKLDLVSNMVLEFPSLQGKMGGIYLKLAGEENDVYQAIADHYLPSGKDSTFPETFSGVVLGIADRFDTVVESFKLGANPTGSQDPLGLRRAVIGICELILEKNFNLNIYETLSFCLNSEISTEIYQKIKNFFLLRIRTIFIDKCLDYDVVDSVLDFAFIDLNNALKIAYNLQSFKHTNKEKLKLICETAVRINRLSKDVNFRKIDENLFQNDIERNIYVHFLTIEKKTISI